jgi:4-amino-4-deoxy-L-arabinose transferase-like glycosyltransferase
MLIIIFLSLWVYFPSLSGQFIWDDNDIYVTKNQIIKTSDGLYKFWITSEAPEYHPMTNSTFWFEWRLWEMNPTGYHVTNLILHIIISLLIWVVLRKFSIPGAFLAAMIFAVHPVNVESVAWIAQRKNQMAMLFFLFSILFYLIYLKADSPATGGPKQNRLYQLRTGRWYLLSLAMFALAMLSKGSVAILPVLLLGIVWWLRPLTRWDFVKSVPFFLVAAALTVVHVWFQTHVTGEAIRTTIDLCVAIDPPFFPSEPFSLAIHLYICYLKSEGSIARKRSIVLQNDCFRPAA